AYRDPTYPFKPGDWFFGSAILPAVKTVTVHSDMPGKIVPGKNATITVEVLGVPPLNVKYLIRDPSGVVLKFDEAERVDDYRFNITLYSNFTAVMKYGEKYTLQLIVASESVAVPEIAKISLDVAPSAVRTINVLTDVPGLIVPGKSANITLEIPTNPPYVRYILISPWGELIKTGEANKTSDTTFSIVLDPSITSEMLLGAQYTLKLVIPSAVGDIPEVTSYTIRTASYTDILSVQQESVLNAIKQLNSGIQTMRGEMASKDEIASLRATIDTLLTVIYAVLGVAVITLVLSTMALVKKK
ncbi:MAG: hypothetical protein QXP68_07230, partial [Thermosphaera sp.]